MKNFVYGNYVYEYEMIRQDRRSISLTVRPDKSLVVKCPDCVKQERVDLFLKRKWSWLNKQLRFFDCIRKQYERQYISGESFYYLGRQYKLVVRESPVERVVLNHGLLTGYTSSRIDDTARTKKLLGDWYAHKANHIFAERFEEMKKRFDYPVMPTLNLKEMPKRWGSFVGKNRVVLNPKLIHAPKSCIDYVLVHELCHMRYRNHDKKFWDFLEEKYPGWEKVKEELELKFGGL